MGLKMRYVLAFFLCFITFSVNSQTRPTGPESVEAVYLLKPSNVFDGEAAQLHEGWVVLVRGERIEAAGPASEIKAPAGARVIDLSGLTLLPGLIDAHTHLNSDPVFGYQELGISVPMEALIGAMRPQESGQSA